MRVAVVIVNFNSGAYLARCLDALEAQTRRPERVVVGRGPLRATVVATRFVGSHVRVDLRAVDGTVLVADVAPAEAPVAGADVALDLPDPWRLPEPDLPHPETT